MARAHRTLRGRGGITHSLIALAEERQLGRTRKPRPPRREELSIDEVRAALEASERGDAKNAVPRRRKRVGPKQRKHGELRDPAYLPNAMRMDKTTYRALKINAQRRGVFTSVLIADILTLWTRGATDPRQQIFRELLGVGAKVANVPERYVGYLASLGFTRAVLAREPEIDPLPSTREAPTEPELPAVPDVLPQTRPALDHVVPEASEAAPPKRQTDPTDVRTGVGNAAQQLDVLGRVENPHTDW